MEFTTLSLYGAPFAERFTMTEGIRVNREMKNEACLTYIESGAMGMLFPIKKTVMRDGESVLMKCGNYIVNTTDLSPISPLKGLIFHLQPDMIRKAFGNKDLSYLINRESVNPVFPAFELGKNDFIDGFVNSMQPYFENTNAVRDDMLAIKLQELITILASTDDEHIRYILGTIQKEEIFEFENIITANIYNKISIPELAHLMNKSESAFKRVFKEIYNESPAKYFKVKKLEKAAELLKTTSDSISEISWECGFEEITHFSSSFSKQYGASPRSYRD
jgi:AraC family transcriptional regulator, exoenzyme S synthesis regulatory protein ExsA